MAQEKPLEKDVDNKATDIATDTVKTKESTVKAEKKAITRIFNDSPCLQYVGDVRIVPDDKGSEFSDELHEAAMKNPGYVHLIKTKKLRVE